VHTCSIRHVTFVARPLLEELSTNVVPRLEALSIVGEAANNMIDLLHGAAPALRELTINASIYTSEALVSFVEQVSRGLKKMANGL